MSDSRKRLVNLDILKFIAAVLIIFHHYQQATGLWLPFINFFGDSRFDFGFLCELFFMVSGYIAAMTDNAEDRACLRAWLYKYVRIFLSVLPAQLFMAAVIYIYHFKTGGWPFDDYHTPGNIIKSILLLQYGWFTPHEYPFNTSLWFICILLFCYAFFYIAKAVTQHFAAVKSCYVYAALVIFMTLCRVLLYGKHYFIINMPMYRGVIPFFTGCLLFYAHRLPTKALNAARAAAVVLLTAAAVLWGINDFYIFVFLVCPPIIDLAVSTGQAEGVLFKKIGGIYFDMYLWHVPLEHLYYVLVLLLALPVPNNAAAMLVFTGITILWAAAVYRFYDIPLQKRLKRSFYK